MPNDPIRIRNADLWSWKWGAWISPAFAYLEERPWTPVVIAGRLCFVASDTGGLDNPDDPVAFNQAKWCVAWGDDCGPWFDDVSNLSEHRERPIYVAREAGVGGPVYTVVWGDMKSQAFDAQISYEAGEDGVLIRAFDPRKGAVEPGAPAVWRSIRPVDGPGTEHG